MSQFSRPPFPGRDLIAWSRAMYEYLNAQASIKGSIEPQPVLLPHQVTGKPAKAASDGIIMFDPTAAAIVVSVNGEWVPLQELLVSGVNIKTINGISVLGAGDLVVSGGGASGIATIDFGTAGTDAFIDVTGQAGILAGSKVFVSINGRDTADNTIDDIWFDPPQVFGGNIVPGTGFTIYGRAIDGTLHGEIDVNWQWS
jgi:hypothetical protein